MKIFDKIPEELTLIKLAVPDKQSLFEKIAVVLDSYGYIEDEFDLLAGLNEREEIMSTGIGQGLAVPHTDCGGARHFVVVIATLEKPIDFQAIDGKPVDVVFALLVPQNRFDLLSRLLAAISRTLKNSDLLTRLRAASSEREALDCLREAESSGGA